MNTRRHLALGLFFLGVVGVLGYYTLFKTDVSFFSERPILVGSTSDAGGLRTGAPVLYAGVRWGQVEEIVPEIDRPRDERVRIVLSLDQPIRLFADHVVRIEASSVLGGVQLTIDPGTPTEPEIDVTQPLRITQAPDVLASLGDLVESSRGDIEAAFAGIRELVDSVRTGDAVVSRLINDATLGQEFSDAVTAFTDTFENARQITQDLRGTEGLLPRLIRDPKLVADVEAIVQDVRDVVRDVRSGEGVLAMLLSDEAARNDVRGTLANARSITAKLDAGEGSLAQLLNDPAMANALQSAAASIQSAGEAVAEFARGIREGTGTVAKLFNDSQLYDNLVAFSKDLAAVGTAVREQQGMLGRLVFDKGIAEKFERVLGTLQGSLEEAREAAPVSAFLSLGASFGF
jgi:phospholipid/cholesterol/gamma-HCH transport system substrate-binding protein